MKLFATFLSVVVIFFQLSCNRDEARSENHKKRTIDLYDYINILPGIFSDQGAWFCVDFPDEKKLGLGKSLILSDSNGYFMSEPLIGLSISSGDSYYRFDIQNQYLPGSLIQIGTNIHLKVVIETIYSDHQTVLLKYNIYNLTDSLAHFSVGWELPSFDSIVNTSAVYYDLGNAILEVNFDKEYQLSGLSFSKDKRMNANDTLTGFIAVRHRFKSENFENHQVLLDAESRFKAHDQRWKKYFSSYQKLNNKKQILAAKCIQTLITNWRHPAGELKHAGLFPSYAYSGFHGFWAWDSWKHAVALSKIDQLLAKNQIRSMFDFQNEAGMIPDCIFRDTLIEKHNWRNTKPPLAAWAVYKVYETALDTSFIIEMLPSLIKYHEWWYVYRDHDENGLCEYGSADGTRIAAAWESGMDNAVRFDSASMVYINSTAWTFNQESVDLNAYLYAEKRYLIKLAEIAEQFEVADEFKSDLSNLEQVIQDSFYNSKHQYFFDIRTTDQLHVEVIGPEAWITLWAHVASEEQARGVVAKIMDSDHFNSYLPFPTLSVSHPEFEPERGYWRGPVWIDQAYFALEGMKNYGYEKEYEEMKEKLLNHAEGLLERQTPIYENYDPRNGMALNAPHFSWSAAHFLLLLGEEN